MAEQKPDPPNLKLIVDHPSDNVNPSNDTNATQVSLMTDNVSLMTDDVSTEKLCPASPVSYMSSSSEDDILVVGQEEIAQLQSNAKKRLQNRKTDLPPIDPSILTDLEEQAKNASRSLERMMKYLTRALSSISVVSQQTVGVYDGAVEHAHGEVEKNIRLMYALIAKCEELDNKMEPVNEIARDVNEIKQMLDVMEKSL